MLTAARPRTRTMWEGAPGALIMDGMTMQRSRRVSDAAIRSTVKRSTRASARLENRTVPVEFKRSAKAERFAIAIEARHKRA